MGLRQIDESGGLQFSCSPPGSSMEESNELELIQFQGTGVQLIVGAF